MRQCDYYCGALDGGSPMSPVDFKKWQCPLSLLLNFHVDFKKVPCPLSILRKVNVPCHYFFFLSVNFKRAQCRLSNLRKGRIALSNLRVKGHHCPGGHDEYNQISDVNRR